MSEHILGHDSSVTRDRANERAHAGEAHGHYTRFASMIATSSVLMFAFMYLNTYRVADVHWSTTRLYMTLIMASTMAVVMLSYMKSMLNNVRLNTLIYTVSAIVFVGALYMVRNQTFISDQAWMRAMIPHHSIAVLTSSRATIEDARVKALASRIIDSQEREIKEMEWLIQDIQSNGIAQSETDANSRSVPKF